MFVTNTKSKFFFWTCFFVPWTILGFEISGFSNISLAFLFCILDIKFWLSYLNQKKSIGTYRLIAVFLFLTVFSAFRANNPVSLFSNFLMPALFCIYVYNGLKVYNIIGLYSGILAASFFTISQWIERMFFKTDFFSFANLRIDLGAIKFGIVQPTGQYGIVDFFSNLSRVSGPAAEPSFFAMTLFALLPIYYQQPMLLFLSLICFFMSFSKVSLMYLFLLLLFWLLFTCRAVIYSYAVFFSVSAYLFLGKLLEFFYGSREAFIFANSSIYTRFLGSLVFFKLNLFEKIFGTGKFQSCNYVSLKWQKVTELGTGYLNFANASDCNLTHASSLGSLIVEAGMIGVLAIILLPFFVIKLIRPDLKIFSLLFQQSIFSMYLCYWFFSFINIHFLTFFVPSYFFLSWVFYKQYSEGIGAK